MKILIEYVDGKKAQQEVHDGTFLRVIENFMAEHKLLESLPINEGFNDVLLQMNGYGEMLYELLVKTGGEPYATARNRTEPETSVQFAGYNRKWLILKLEYDEKKTEYIFALLDKGTGHYQILKIDPKHYAIGEEGEIIAQSGSERFVFESSHMCWPNVLLDPLNSLMIAYVQDLLNHDEGKPITSLLKCPHPYKMYGIQIKEKLQAIYALLMTE